MAINNMSITDVTHFVDKARHNLVALESNLIELGYEFANPFGAVQLADASDVIAIKELAKEEGPLPVLFQRWYEVFRCVDFSQARSQLTQGNNTRVAGLGLNCTLVFRDIGSCMQLRKELQSSGCIMLRPDGKQLFPVGGSASNCMPKGVWIPDDSVDPILYDDGAGPITMFQEVFAALEVGGFPFWERMFRRRRFTSPLGFSPAYNDIQPMLMRNLQIHD